MSSPETIDLLNRVLTNLRRSFPQYLRYARPYIPAGDERAVETFHEIADGQDTLSERVNELIVKSGALPQVAAFPMEFTDTHDLDLDYLIREAIGYQRQDIADLKACAESLQLAPAARSLVEEALGMAKGHLESLEELAGARATA
jgi:bacterioferritin (cytochrome b1)